MVRVKVCGITSERDALEAVYLGVDAIGFDFRKGSPRGITPQAAAAIAEKLPAFMTRVGVFANDKPKTIADAVDAVGLTAVQFSGDESPEDCLRVSVPWFKALRTGPGFRLEHLGDYSCNTYLLGAAPGQPKTEGGAPAHWPLARSASHYGRILLSGGLSTGNVASAIIVARPYAVDVIAGVEVNPGVKDIDELERFMAAVRRGEARLAAELEAAQA